MTNPQGGATPGDGFLSVSKAQFFAVVGPRDVHPRVDVTSFKGRFHRSNWETPYRERVGVSFSDSSCVSDDAFFLRATLARTGGDGK